MTYRPGTTERPSKTESLEALTRKAGGLAHDFNNMLAIIMGVTEKLAADLDEGAEEQKLALVALHAAERGADLLKQMLAAAHDLRPAPVALDCGQAIADAMRFVHHAVPPTIEIWSSAPPEPLRCLADPAGLEGALMNLCLNAAHAMPRGGLLRIDARVAQLDGLAAGRLGLSPGLYVALTVRDNGCGMSADVLAQAMEPLFTTRRDLGGTGLGLASVSDFARDAGGGFAMASREGEGTAATLYLPMAPVARDLREIRAA